MDPVEITRGDSPVVLGMPHTGTHVPDDILATFNDTGRALADTDWFIDRLYGGLLPGATTVRATFHRYVIDANRDPSGKSLYPGQNTTGLCPVIDFDGAPIYHDGMEPDAGEIERRRLAFHAPYHAALAAEIERVRDKHGIAILYDCHSIRSEIDFLFEGTLPDFNVGTNDGKACAAGIGEKVHGIVAAAQGYTAILNGRFKGGWTTRHYGEPERNVHAVQMELTQKSYLAGEAAPFDIDEARAARVRAPLGTVLAMLEAWAFDHTRARRL